MGAKTELIVEAGGEFVNEWQIVWIKPASTWIVHDKSHDRCTGTGSPVFRCDRALHRPDRKNVDWLTGTACPADAVSIARRRFTLGQAGSGTSSPVVPSLCFLAMRRKGRPSPLNTGRGTENRHSPSSSSSVAFSTLRRSL